MADTMKRVALAMLCACGEEFALGPGVRVYERGVTPGLAEAVEEWNAAAPGAVLGVSTSTPTGYCGTAIVRPADPPGECAKWSPIACTLSSGCVAQIVYEPVFLERSVDYQRAAMAHELWHVFFGKLHSEDPASIGSERLTGLNWHVSKADGEALMGIM